MNQVGIEIMNEKKARHDYVNSVQILKNFVRIAARGKFDLASSEGLGIIDEVRNAIAFLENYPISPTRLYDRRDDREAVEEIERIRV
jgi:hypothetical protein